MVPANAGPAIASVPTTIADARPIVPNARMLFLLFDPLAVAADEPTMRSAESRVNRQSAW
jgi:hypothetical protein